MPFGRPRWISDASTGCEALGANLVRGKLVSALLVSALLRTSGIAGNILLRMSRVPAGPDLIGERSKLMAGSVFPGNASFLLDRLCERVSEAVERSADFCHEQPVAAPGTTETKPPDETLSGKVKPRQRLLPNSEQIGRLPPAAQLPPVPGLPPVAVNAPFPGAGPGVEASSELVEIRLRQLRYSNKVMHFSCGAKLSP
jgi:hypothetical protein